MFIVLADVEKFEERVVGVVTKGFDVAAIPVRADPSPTKADAVMAPVKFPVVALICLNADITSVPLILSTPEACMFKLLSIVTSPSRKEVPDTDIFPETAKAEAVTAFVTSRFDRAASEPLVISFFQFGILLILWLVTRLSPLPVTAYNSFYINSTYNIIKNGPKAKFLLINFYNFCYFFKYSIKLLKFVSGILC